ncbi:MAG: radical SAM protein [Oscillospiraceae bacterium]|nr:radical SAM protein [Oscillospiraceae bacterium]
MAFFVPHLGCPHRCSFCDQKSISGSLCPPSPAEVARTCEAAAQRLKNRAFPAEIAFFGGSFTAVDPALMQSLLQAAFPFVTSGDFDGIRISTRPDAIDPPVLSLLKKYGVTVIELGAQSMDNGVLEKNGRGHTAQDVKQAARLIRQAGFQLGLQMMIGLPGDSEGRCRDTARQIAALEPDCVRLYPTLVVENTELARWYRQGTYLPLTVEQAVEQTAWLLRFFEEKKIPVIRIGLHAETSLQQSCLAGPFHPAFGELCYSRAWLDRLLEQLAQSEAKGLLQIFVRPENHSKAVGQKRENIRRLAALGYQVKILPNPSLPAEIPFLIKEVKDCI